MELGKELCSSHMGAEGSVKRAGDDFSVKGREMTNPKKKLIEGTVEVCYVRLSSVCSQCP